MTSELGYLSIYYLKMSASCDTTRIKPGTYIFFTNVSGGFFAIKIDMLLMKLPNCVTNDISTKFEDIIGTGI